MAPEPEIIYGRRALLEALRAGEPLNEVQIAQGSETRGALKELLAEADRMRVPVRWVPPAELDRAFARAGGRGRHQGALGFASAFRYSDVAEILAEALRRKEDPFLLVLDTVQDVHNLGSLIRSAEAAGAHGVVLAEEGAASVTPAVRNASAGAIAHLRVARANLVETLDALKARGVRIVGLEEDAEVALHAADLSGPIALVVGSEARGLRHAIDARCSLKVSIPMRGRVGSLNAAVAGSLALFEVVRQRA